MRYLVSWAASLPNFCLASLDVTAAFLNAPLPTGRIGVLRSVTSWSRMAYHKAIYGLREAPSLWSELTFTSGGENYAILCHRSIDPCVSLSASGLYRITLHLLGVSQRPLTLTLLKKHRDTNGES